MTNTHAATQYVTQCVAHCDNAERDAIILNKRILNRIKRGCRGVVENPSAPLSRSAWGCL